MTSAAPIPIPGVAPEYAGAPGVYGSAPMQIPGQSAYPYPMQPSSYQGTSFVPQAMPMNQHYAQAPMIAPSHRHRTISVPYAPVQYPQTQYMQPGQYLMPPGGGQYMMPQNQHHRHSRPHHHHHHHHGRRSRSVDFAFPRSYSDSSSRY
ncbi:hypothetical protein R3P38DRAFT_2951996 [Favolaschia claudopus]|uniref:Uncharacterized protein n=1 Tax=Favolaschia claudopus TaxID=2862362 RepID=A0AAW0BI50_9AGAR